MKKIEKIENKQNLTKKEVNFLREKFVIKYAKNKGWNLENLSTSQMMEIISKDDYKFPKISIS